jgi:hypothetical protein
MRSAIDFSDPAAANKISSINPIYSALIEWSQNILRSTQNLTIWMCGIIIGTNGLLLRTPALGEVNKITKIYFPIGTIIFGLIGLLFIIAMHRRYSDILNGIRRVNFAQRVYEKDVFIANDSLFPEHWNAGDSRPFRQRVFSFNEEPVFPTSYIAILLSTLFGAVMGLLS